MISFALVMPMLLCIATNGEHTQLSLFIFILQSIYYLYLGHKLNKTTLWDLYIFIHVRSFRGRNVSIFRLFTHNLTWNFNGWSELRDVHIGRINMNFIFLTLLSWELLYITVKWHTASYLIQNCMQSWLPIRYILAILQ